MTDMRSEYTKTLIQVGKENSNVVALGADTTDSLKTSGFGKEFPDRFFNVGIAEGNLVTVSAGLAISGKISFASTYAIFLPGRAVDQIRNNIAYPSPQDKQGLDVKLVVSHGGLSVGPDGGSHQQIEDIAIMRVIPNFRVFIPADTVAVSKLTQLMANELWSVLYENGKIKNSFNSYRISRFSNWKRNHQFEMVLIVPLQHVE